MGKRVYIWLEYEQGEYNEQCIGDTILTFDLVRWKQFNPLIITIYTYDPINSMGMIAELLISLTYDYK